VWVKTINKSLTYYQNLGFQHDMWHGCDPSHFWVNSQRGGCMAHGCWCMPSCVASSTFKLNPVCHSFPELMGEQSPGNQDTPIFRGKTPRFSMFLLLGKTIRWFMVSKCVECFERHSHWPKAETDSCGSQALRSATVASLADPSCKLEIGGSLNCSDMFLLDILIWPL